MMEHWGAAVVSAGDVLRAEIAAGTPLGQEAARYMENGGLVPDRVALASVESWLDAHLDAFVFDGFPRTVGQAEALHDSLERRHAPLNAVLWLELSLASIEERVRRRVVCTDCGRSFQVGSQVASVEQLCPVCGGRLIVRHDDDPIKLVNRMEQYREHTEPVMNYYEGQGLLRRVEAEGAPEAVFARIEAALTVNAELEAATR